MSRNNQVLLWGGGLNGASYSMSVESDLLQRKLPSRIKKVYHSDVREVQTSVCPVSLGLDPLSHVKDLLLILQTFFA